MLLILYAELKVILCFLAICFKKKFGKNLEDVYNIKPLLKSKELIKKKDNIFINPSYIYVMNEILLKII